MKLHITINNTLVDSDDLDMVEDIQPEAIDDLSDGNDTPVLTADDIISASLESGVLAGVCEVTMAVREIDNQEEERFREFTCQVAAVTGPNKTPCCLLFSVDYYQSVRDTLTELTHNELDLLVMGQVMAHTIQTINLQGHHSTSPAERKEIKATFTTLATVCVKPRSCSSTPSALRGSRTSRGATSTMDHWCMCTGVQVYIVAKCGRLLAI